MPGGIRQFASASPGPSASSGLEEAFSLELTGWIVPEYSSQRSIAMGRSAQMNRRVGVALSSSEQQFPADCPCHDGSRPRGDTHYFRPGYANKPLAR